MDCSASREETPFSSIFLPAPPVRLCRTVSTTSKPRHPSSSKKDQSIPQAPLTAAKESDIFILMRDKYITPVNIIYDVEVLPMNEKNTSWQTLALLGAL